jgi:hypothetical protein
MLVATWHYLVFKKFVPDFLNDFRVLRREQCHRTGINKRRNGLA